MNICDKPGLTPIAEAIEEMLSNVNIIKEIEAVSLMAACGRVLSSDVVSPVDVPPANNSAMDGYALHEDDLAKGSTIELVGKSMAGNPFKGQIIAGQCIRIMTGAVIPSGASAVVMQEQTSVQGNQVSINVDVIKGNNVRLAGEDIEKGNVVLCAGTKLLPSHLSLLASLGVGSVEVIRRAKVAIVATGDELTPPDQPLAPGAIYESNRYALYAMLINLGCIVEDFGIVKDDVAALRLAFTKAKTTCDLVITSGGVSVGDADYVKDVLKELGNVGFWKVAIKPGKPFAFGKLGNALFCGLPGNPVSSYVTFQQLVIPVLKKLTAQSQSMPLILKARATSNIRKRPGRADFQRGIYTTTEQGELVVEAYGKQGSGVMSSITQANCYILLKQAEGDVVADSIVEIQPFIGLM